MNKKYITIKEFSKAAGISTQAVYKQVDNRLKPYLKMVDGKKMINVDALKLYKEEKPQEHEENSNSTSCATSCSTIAQPQKVEQQIIDLLKDELDKKNKQIEKLQEQLDKAQTLISQEQQLRLVEQQKYIDLKEQVDDLTKEEAEPKKKGLFSRFFGS